MQINNISLSQFQNNSPSPELYSFPAITRTNISKVPIMRRSIQPTISLISHQIERSLQNLYICLRHLYAIPARNVVLRANVPISQQRRRKFRYRIVLMCNAKCGTVRSRREILS